MAFETYYSRGALTKYARLVTVRAAVVRSAWRNYKATQGTKPESQHFPRFLLHFFVLFVASWLNPVLKIGPTYFPWQVELLHKLYEQFFY